MRTMGITKYILAVSIGIAGGCNPDNPKIDLPAPDLNTLSIIRSNSFKQSATISDTVALDSLVKYLGRYPDLRNLLESPDEYTLFAPSNKAFKDMLNNPALPRGLTMDNINSTLVEGILSYHFVENVKLKSDLIEGAELSSLFTDPQMLDEPHKIIINSDGTLKTGSQNKSIKITRPDNESINGVVHMVESVLLPSSIIEMLEMLSGTIMLNITIIDNFSTLAELIHISDIGFVENPSQYEFKIKSWLSMPDIQLNTIFEEVEQKYGSLEGAPSGGLTFFALSNSTINNWLDGKYEFLNRFTRDKNPEPAREFLLNHIVIGKYTKAKIIDGLILKTLAAGIRSFATNPTTLTVEIGLPDLPLNPLGITLRTKSKIKAAVQVLDIEADNCILHTISNELTPD